MKHLLCGRRRGCGASVFDGCTCAILCRSCIIPQVWGFLYNMLETFTCRSGLANHRRSSFAGHYCKNAMPRPSIVFHNPLRKTLFGPKSTFPLTLCNAVLAIMQHCMEGGEGVNFVGIRNKKQSVLHIFARIVA